MSIGTQTPTKSKLSKIVADAPIFGASTGKSRFTGEDENRFQSWYSTWADKAGLDPDPDNPRHKYDYRAAFKAGVEPTIDPSDKQYHWPSEFKADDHPNRFIQTEQGILDSKTGKIGKIRLDSILASAPVFDEATVVNRTRDLMDEYEQLTKQPQAGPVFKRLGELTQELESNKTFQDYGKSIGEANKKHAGALKLIGQAEQRPSLKSRLGLFPGVQEYQRDAERLTALQESPEVQAGIKAQEAYQSILDQHGEFLTRFSSVQQELSQADPTILEKAQKLLRFDVEKAKDYLSKVTKPEYQQTRSGELKTVRDQLYAKYKENSETDPAAAQAFLREMSKIDEEIERDFYDTREKTDIARRIVAGDTERLTDEPAGPIREVISKGIEGLLSTTPITAGSVSGLDFRRRVEGFQQTDPDFAQIIRGEVKQREPGTLEQISGGAAHILGLIPSFRASGQVVAKAFPRIGFVPLARTSAKGSKVVLQGSEAARVAATNILRAPARGAATFSTQATITGSQTGSETAPVTGAAFETTQGIAVLVEQSLPARYRSARYIAPMVRAFISGTSFAGGSAAGAALLGEGEVNIYEEFGKGFLLSLFHTAGDKIEKRINEKDPNLRTREDEKILEKAKMLKAAKDVNDIQDAVGKPEGPKPPVTKTVVTEPGLEKSRRPDLQETLEKLRGTTIEKVDAGQKKTVEEGDKLTSVQIQPSAEPEFPSPKIEIEDIGEVPTEFNLKPVKPSDSKKLIDLRNEREDEMNKVFSFHEVVDAKLAELREELKASPKRSEERKQLVKKIEELEGSKELSQAVFEEKAIETSEQELAGILEEAKQRGLKFADEEQEQNFKESVQELLSIDRPNIEYNSDKTIKELVDEAIQEWKEQGETEVGEVSTGKKRLDALVESAPQAGEEQLSEKPPTETAWETTGLSREQIDYYKSKGLNADDLVIREGKIVGLKGEKEVGAQEALTALRGQESGRVSESSKRLSSTQVNIPADESKPLVDFAKSIPEADIYDTPEKEFGRETEPHVTALFGLKDATPEQIRDIVQNFGKIRLTLGKTSVFKNPEYDVLKVDVESEELVRINKMLRKGADYESDFPDYKPHLTIAYLKPGMGKKYAGDARFEEMEFTVSELMFSDPDFTKTPINLESGRMVGESPKWREIEERVKKGEDIKEIGKDIKEREFPENWKAGEQIEIYNYVTQQYDIKRTVAEVKNGIPTTVKSAGGTQEPLTVARYRRPDSQKEQWNVNDPVEVFHPTNNEWKTWYVARLQDGKPAAIVPEIGARVHKVLGDQIYRKPETKPVESETTDIQSAEEIAKEYGGISPASIKAYQEAFKEAEQGNPEKLISILHTGNKNLRKYFTDQTGITLPKTEGGSGAAITEWAKGQPSRKNAATDLPKSFRDKIIAKLGGPDVLTPFGTVDRLSSQDLIRAAEQLGIDLGGQTKGLTEHAGEKGATFNRQQAEDRWSERFALKEQFDKAYGEKNVQESQRLSNELQRLREEVEGHIAKVTGKKLPAFTADQIDEYFKTGKVPELTNGLKLLSQARPIEEKREGLINEVVSRLMAKESTWNAVRNNSKDNAMLFLPKEVQNEAIDIATSLDDIDLIGFASDDKVLLDGIAEKVYTSIAEEIQDERQQTTGEIERDAPSADQGALEGTPPEDVSGTEGEGGTRERTPRSGRTDRGSDVPAEKGTHVEGPRSNVGGSIGVGTAQGAVVVSPGRNYRITPADGIGEGTVTQKFAANLAAIELLKKLESEARQATPEEMRILVKYVGWGGMAQAFDQYNDKWSAKHKRLLDLLTEEEYESARASTLNAHYTSIQVIEAMYRLTERLGFKGGRILEPSMGVGHFLGLLPASIARTSKLMGIELDSLTGRLAKQLYPDADIRIQGYEKTSIPDDYFDVVISNFPFGDYPIPDPDARLRGMTGSIHNYFFGKSLLKVRPGGLVIAITSRYTMDSQNSAVRQWMNEKATFLGAMRLPSSAFEGNAGTAVTTDIIVLQKREGPAGAESPVWIQANAQKGPSKQEYNLNEYYIQNPNMMLGKISFERGLYGGNEFSIKKDERNLVEAIDTAIQTLPANAYQGKAATAKTEKPAAELIPAEGSVKQGGLTLKNGKVFQRSGDEMKEIPVAQKEVERIKGLISIRDQVRKTLRIQLEDKPEAEIKKAQAELNKSYDAFRKKFGFIYNQGRSKYRDDPDYQLLQSLEKIDHDKKTVEKADIFSKRVLFPIKRIETAQSSNDALSVVLEEKGRIDFDRMQDLTGKSKDELITDLAGVIFRTPQQDWATADEYLSGNVKQKLNDAQAAAEIDSQFNANVEALKDVLPEDLKPNEIEARLGSSWIPPSDITDFVSDILNMQYIEIKYLPALAQWNLIGAKRYQSEISNIKKWGIPRYPALDLVRDALNGQFPTVWDIDRSSGSEKRVVNVKETAAAREKMQVLKDEFKKWIWKDAARMKRLTDYYNENFNNFIVRKYDGKHLRFEGMSPEWRGKLRDYQKDAVWRQIVGGNTLLAHVVGAGKTFEMIAAAMEMRRLGTRKKPMFVVPNHMLEQWKDDIYKLYPAANILMATKADFSKEKRSLLMSKIATGDWDAVLVTHSGYERITMGADYYEKFINEQILELEAAIAEERASEGRKTSRAVKDLEKKKKRLEAKLEKVIGLQKKDVTVTFDELGVDQLFIDEAHYFKNLFVVSRLRNIAGLSFSESDRAMDMFLKTKYVGEFNNGNGGIVFATGTPVTNSLAELYTMQRYLQMATLKENDLDKFDNWAANFGEVQTVLEMSVEGKGFRARNRFSKLVNFGELMTRFLQVADIKNAAMINLSDIPTIKGGKMRVVTAPSNPVMKAFLEQLAKRAAAVRSRSVDPSIDNMLKISTDGRKAAIDMRLIDPSAGDYPDNKLSVAANEIHRIWKETTADKLTQIVFIDFSTPTKIKFNAYDDLKSKLIKLGIPAQEIVFIHDTEATSNVDIAKKELFRKVNNGIVRVLFGSTNKLGVGTNVQRLLVAEHNIDVAWRPADMDQRAGRIIRSGNTNKEVEIIQYVTETSFDAYMWETLKAKIRAIEPIYSGNIKIRSVEDVEGKALTAAEVAAIASGNPIVLEKANVDMEVARLEALESSFNSNMYDSKMRMAAIPERVQEFTKQIEGAKKDIATLQQHPTKGEAFEVVIGKKTFTERKEAGQELIRLAKDIQKKDMHFKDIPVGTFRGLAVELNVGFADAGIRLVGSVKKYSAKISEDALGTIRSLEFTADTQNIEGAISQFEKEIARNERMKAELEEELQRPFEQHEKLERYRTRLLELQKELDLDKSENTEQAETEEEESEREEGEEEDSDETTFGVGLGAAIPGIVKQVSKLFQGGELPLEGVQFTDGRMREFFKGLNRGNSRLARVIAIPFWVGEKYPGFGNTYEKGKVVKEGVWNIIDRIAVREYLENRVKIERDFLNEWKDAKALTKQQRNAIVEVFRILNEESPQKNELPNSEIQKLFGLDDQAVKVYRQIRNALDAGMEARKALDRYRIKNGYFVPRPQELKRFLKKTTMLEAGLEADIVDEIRKFLKDTPARSMSQDQVRLLWNIPEVKEIVATAMVERKYHKKLISNYFPMTRPADEKYAVVARKPSGSAYEMIQDTEAESSEESLEDSFMPTELYFATFRTADEANAHANEIKRLGYLPVEGEPTIIAYNRTKDMPERFVGRFSEEQLMDLVEEAGVDRDTALVKSLVEELRSRNFDRHFIERQRIPGFQWKWENIEKNTTEHVDSALRRYAKSVGLSEAEKRFREISDTMSPRNREYAREFLDAFVHANPREWEGIRQVIYIAALGFSVSNGLQNLTQPFMTTLNEITIGLKEAKVGFKPFLSEKIFSEALGYALAFTLVKLGRKAGKEFPIIPPEWQRLADKARDQGVINPLQLEQMAGIVDDPRVKYLSTPRKTWRVITVITGLFQRLTEVGNRDHAFFAGMIVGGKYLKLTGNDLYEYAVRFNYRTNFAFGAHNLPQAAKAVRGTWWASTIRKVANLWFILRGFSLNMLGRQGAVIRSRSAGAIARNVIALLTLAGFRGLPFMAMVYTLANIVLWLIGDEETIEIKERRAFGEIERDLGLAPRTLTTGPVGAYTGVETSRLVGVGDILPRSLNPRDVGGVALSYADRTGRSLKELAEGDVGEAFEQFPLKPRVLSDQMRANRIAEEGVISSGYVNLPPEKITAADEVKLRMGLTPTKVTESYEKGRAMASLGRLGREKYNSLIDDYVSAMVRNDGTKQADIIKKITVFNGTVSLDNQIDLKRFIRDAVMRRYDISRNKRKIPRRTQLQELYYQGEEEEK